MKNPLDKRRPRELREELGKYLVIFLLMIFTIGFISGFLVADGSMEKAYNEGFTKYNIENGNFKTKKKINKAGRKAIESLGIKLYDNYYIDEEMQNESTVRIFVNRSYVNLVCLMEGKMPETSDEIAIDRMYADNNGLSVGDTLVSAVKGKVWKITGLVALPDYSALFSSNNDSMFDSIKFGVSVVTDEGFATLNQDKINYSYSWIYDNPPDDESQESDIAQDLMENIAKEVSLENFVPRYLNQAITFTGEDMGSDKVMMVVLLYIIIVIMAFVFAVTTSNTIVKEANVIGTLRANGFTRNELIWHYMMTPLIVTLLGAIIGNILGYTFFKNVCVGMYYGSYSLPTYVTIWSAEAFVKTTIVPMIIMIAINYFILRSRLMLSPLKFLRRDLTNKKNQKAIKLPGFLPFFTRFRTRVILQNISNYIVLFVGVAFANLLLIFGMIFPSILHHYQDTIEDSMLCKYQYMLQVPVNVVSSDSKMEQLFSMMLFAGSVETENADAEKFSAYSLQSMDETILREEIVLYGIDDNSRYITADFTKSDGGVYVTSGYCDKYGIAVGDSITLKEKYKDDEYTFDIVGICDFESMLAVFMPRETLNETFDLGKNYFAGYFSNTPITDIDEEYIGSVIDIEDMTKISRQLIVSMGGMMGLVQVFAIAIYMILIYLLSKIIIEKNAHSISMAKILGYSNWEISRLYIISTTLVVIICILVSLPLECRLMYFIFKRLMTVMVTGWIPYYLDPVIPVKMFVMGIGTYAVIALFEFHKIKKVPMTDALKNVE